MSAKQQTFDSNGPDVRVRGNAYQVLEKYLAMARDASSAGDRIAAENYLQHAEHYYRIINANPESQGQNGRPRPNMRPDGNGYDQANGNEAGGEMGADGGEGDDDDESDDYPGGPA
ncbi:MAG: DUF4167 domain-containing protein [Dongiaceae bacterium]